MEDLISQFQRLDLNESNTSENTKPTGFLYHKDCEDHYSSSSDNNIGCYKHPEHPDRVRAPKKFIESTFHKTLKDLVRVKGGKMDEEKASIEDLRSFVIQEIDDFEEISLDIVRLTHPQAYIEHCLSYFDRMYEEHRIEEGSKAKSRESFTFLRKDEDIYVSSGSSRAIKLSANAAIIAADKVMQDEWENAFVLTRPPGHHARFSGLKGEPEGFCFFNNASIAVNYIRDRFKVEKIAIFDWDVHHGDGTQEIFFEDPNVLYVSTHQYEDGIFYPHTKYADDEQVGIKEGTGYNVNVGYNLYQKDTLYDEDYCFIFDVICMNIISAFEPGFIVVSAGYDSSRGDTLGGLDISPRAYYHVVQMLKKAQKRVIVLLEGGYVIDNIKHSTFSTTASLLGMNESHISQSLVEGKNYLLSSYGIGEIFPQEFAIEKVRYLVSIHRRFWANIDWDAILLLCDDKSNKRRTLNKIIPIIGGKLKLISSEALFFDITKVTKKKIEKAATTIMKKFGLTSHYDIDEGYLQINLGGPLQLATDDTNKVFLSSKVDTEEPLVLPLEDNVLISISKYIHTICTITSDSLN